MWGGEGDGGIWAAMLHTSNRHKLILMNGPSGVFKSVLPLTFVSCCSLRVNAVLEGGLRLSQLSALSLLEMSSSESLGVENGELLSTSSYLRLRLRDEPASMETCCLRARRHGRITERAYRVQAPGAQGVTAPPPTHPHLLPGPKSIPQRDTYYSPGGESKELTRIIATNNNKGWKNHKKINY